MLAALILLAGTATATEPAPLVRTMADASATWEQRCRAEDDLAKCSAPEALAALLLHGCLKLPDGPICNGAGREMDHKLNIPVKWQIFYATHRAWDIQTKKLAAAERQTLWPDLLRQAATATATAKVKVLQELANHWVPAAQSEVAKLLKDPQQEFPVRRSAGFCLALHAAEQFHDPLVALLENAPAAERKPWFDVLADSRHRRAAGVDRRVVRVGFALLEEERRRSPDYIHGAYFLALTLGNYGGTKKDFQPDTPPDSPEFFAATVRNAVSWWEQHRGEIPKPNR